MITRNSLIERTSYVIERTLLPVLTDWEDIMNECAEIFHLRGHNTGLGGHYQRLLGQIHVILYTVTVKRELQI
jgi:hypothetical protein